MFKRKNLYRVELTQNCYRTFIAGYGNAMPSLESIENKGNYGCIPIGTKGWIIENYGTKYFRPDEDQEGIDLYTPADQPIVLIPYKTIEGRYKVISENDKL